MSILFLEYPKCSTCQRAKKWLVENGIEFTDRHIVEENPTVEEIRQFHQKSGLPLKRFFNTSGMKYKELQLKDKLPSMTEEMCIRDSHMGRRNHFGSYGEGYRFCQFKKSAAAFETVSNLFRQIFVVHGARIDSKWIDMSGGFIFPWHSV